MKIEEKINYKIDSNALKSYVEAINSIKKTMTQIKVQLNQLRNPIKKQSKLLKPIQEELKSINTMSNAIRNYRLNIQTNEQKYLQKL